MIPRKHQTAETQMCFDIRHGAPIRENILAATPGSGKSSIPVILSKHLIGQIADRLCWLAPRDSLKYQGESEFLNPMWETDRRIRAADNGNDLSRGYDGYVSTYQAVGADPECHLREFSKHNYILFMDENHHIARDSKWACAIAPLVERASLVVKASGTLSRGDGEKVAFMDYVNGEVDLTNTEHRRVVTYSRSEAIRDGAIMRVGFHLVDGESDWEEMDGTKGSSKLSGEESAKALFTALRTDYANQLLDECLEDFFKELLVYPKAKMLVVAPNIAVAEAYHDYLAARGQFVRIATSDDSTTAKQNINAYKRGEFHMLVTVGMAYEGLNVPEITHICCLTHIRSMPWLEQCFARGNRLAPGKLRAIVYAPADHNFKKAMRMIEREQLVPLSNPDEQMDLVGSSEEKRGEGTGEARPWIIPTGSTAYVDGVPVPEKPSVLAGLPNITPSEAEKILRKNIHQHITAFLDPINNGSKVAYQKILYRRMRIQVQKPIAEMNLKELETVWMWLRKEYQLKEGES